MRLSCLTQSTSITHSPSIGESVIFAKFKIANIDSGVGILKPQANYEYIRIPELKHLTFKDFYKSYYKKLPIINSEEALKFIDE